MNGLSLSKETQENISQVIGVDFASIVDYEPLEEMSLIGKTIVFSKKRNLKKIGRGNPLLARHKIRTLDEVNKKLSRIK